jgi:hypothetical protein
MKKIFLLVSLVLLTGPPGLAQQNDVPSSDPNDRLTPWSFMLYKGWTSTETLAQTVQFTYKSAGEDVYAAEIAYTLAPTNPVSRFFSHIWSKFQLAGNLAIRDEHNNDKGPIYEFNAYFVLRWQNWPWNRYLPTSVAIGEGLSYASRVPEVEIGSSTRGGDSKRVLNYLMGEITVAHPAYPEIQLVGRIHHRSGAYGAFGAGNAGSNTVGVGLRYHF